MPLTALEGRPLSTPAPTPSPNPSPNPNPDPAPNPSPDSVFARLLHALTTEIDRGERATTAAIRSARAGRDLSTLDLISLQAQIYRYVEAVDLASKLVDRAANGVRTVVQAQ